MAEKFTINLLQYASSDVGTLECAINEINAQIEAADAGTSTELIQALEEGIEQLKGKAVPGLARSEGWSPMIKLTGKVISQGEGDAEQRRRTMAVLLELLGLSSARAVHAHATELAQLALELLEAENETAKNCTTTTSELRLISLEVLSAIFEKFRKELPPGMDALFPHLQPALLAVLSDKNDQRVRELANKCMSAVISFHSDPNGVFAVLSEMSDDCELILKDDPLLDDLIEKCWARDNEIMGRG